MEISNLWVIPGNWIYANALTLIGAAFVLTVGWYLSRLAERLIRDVLPRHPVDKNFAPLLSQVARYGILIFAFGTALSLLGVATASIYAVLGAAGLAIALALQGTLANIAAGIMLIWLRPVAIGEYVSFGAVAGVIVEIGLFGTRIRSTSGLFIFVPNQILWASAITNHSREPRRRIDVNLTVPDSMDIPQARQMLAEIASRDPRVLRDPEPSVHVESVGTDTVVLQIRAWVATPDYLKTRYDLTETAKLELGRELKRQKAGVTVEASTVHDPNALELSGKPLGPE